MAKKKVLIVNKFLYPRGGDCIVALSEADLLRRAGHEVALWAMDYPDNIPTATSALYAPRVDFSGGIKDKIAAVKRTLGYGDIEASFGRMLSEFRPDTVHFHNIHSYLSPRIVEMAKAAGARTLWTMHDYKIVCPSYSCLRPDGKPCTECLTHPGSVVRHRCMKGSFAASLIARAEALCWNAGRLSEATDAFVCPSRFMASMIAAAGVEHDKIHVVCNHLDHTKMEILTKIPADSRHRDPSLLVYAGRLSREKGIHTLLATFAEMADPALSLRIYGTGPLEAELKRDFASTPGVKFLGHADAATIARDMAGAAMTVVPSECYENNPLSAIESRSAGTPVLGADIGGIPELITPSTGMLFEPADRHALAGAIRGMLVRSFDHKAIKTEAMERFSPQKHLNLLQNLL